MRTLVCDFTISSIGDEIEEIVMYDEDNFTEERMTEVINKMIKDKMIVIGEKCEGTIEVELGTFFVEYKWCSDVMEDESDDVWNDEEFEVNILKV